MDAIVPPGNSHNLPGPSLVNIFHHEYQTAGNAGQYPAYAVLGSNSADQDDGNYKGRNFYCEGKKRRLTNEQVKFLEVSYAVETKLEPERKNQLAQELGLQPRQVAVWFQNRRARSKVKQLERDYDILKMEYDAMLLEKDKLKAEVARLKHLLDSVKGEGASSGHTPSMNEHIQFSYTTVRNSPDYRLQEQDDETQEDQAENPSTAAHYQQSPTLQSDDTKSKQVIITKHRGSEAGDASSESDLGDVPSSRSTSMEYMMEQLYHQTAAAKLSLAEMLYSDPHQLLQQIAEKMGEGFLQPPDLYNSNVFQNFEHEEGDSVLCFSRQH